MTEMITMSEIIISDDFRILEQDYSEKELTESKLRLEEQALPFKFFLWDGILLLDFQLFEYCQSQKIVPDFETLSFQTKIHAESWICTQQLMRVDLTEEYKKYLIGKKYALEISIQKDDRSKLFSGKQVGNFSLSQNSKAKIAKRIGEELSIKFNTVQKYNVYSEAIDCLLTELPQFAKKILSGQLRVSHKNIIKLAEQPREVLIKIMNYVDENKIEHLGYSELTNDFQFKGVQQPQTPKQTDDEPGIRKMPVYDPDSEISSITLTIPSWVSSMERAHSRTDYSKTSTSSRINLVKQLAILERTISILQKAIEEVL